MNRAWVGVLLVGVIAAGCGGGQAPAESEDVTESASPTSTPMPWPSATEAVAEEQIAVAEEMIDAFYAFDPELLADILSSAEGSSDRILAYQGWAEGAHYKVLERPGCEVIQPNLVECPVTVEDDLLLALGSDFKVTDVFTLAFNGTDIVSVSTGSNDPEVVHQAFEWVFATHPELEEGACKSNDEGVEEAPGDCARAVVAGFREFAESAEFPGAP